mgnify:CR=1 FL=1
MGVALGMAESEKATATLSAAIAFFVMHATISTLLDITGKASDGSLHEGSIAQVVGINSLQMGVFGGNVAPTDLTVMDGLRIAAACLPMATGCAISAPAQGRVAATAINLMAKRPNDWAKGIILCITVEFYAILSLLASILLLMNAL